MRIIRPDSVTTTLNGKSIQGWRHTVENELPADEYGALSKALNEHPDGTHVITFRYQEDIKQGELDVNGEQWEVLSAFDPYARADYNPRAATGVDRRRQFLKVLVKKGA